MRGYLSRTLSVVLLALLAEAASAQIPVHVQLFMDGFESGDFGAWSFVADGGGDLAVVPNATMGGTMAMQATVDDTSGLWVQDDSPPGEHYFDGQFAFDPNGFDPGEAQDHRRVRIFIAFESPSRRLMALVLRRIGGQYALRARVRQDDGSQVDTPFFDITDAPHTIYFQWRRSSGPDAQDGLFRLMIDGVERSVLTGLDNSISVVDFTRMGAISVKTGATGVMYWDTQFAWRDLAPAHAQLVINEVDYDQPTFFDNDEFIEIYNPGPALVPLAGVTLVQFHSEDNNAYRTVPLDGAGPALAPFQYLLVANNSVPIPAGVLWIKYVSPFENIEDAGPPGGADGLALFYAATCHQLDSLAYEGNFWTANGPCGPTPLVETAATFAYDPALAGSIIRMPNGSDTDDASVDWASTTTVTPGTANVP